MLNRIFRLLLIRKNEYRQVGYFFLLFCLIGAGLSIGRGTSDALFFKRYGIQYLPVMYMILSVLLCTISTVYAAFADRIPAEQFFKYLFIGGAAVLSISWLMMSQGTWNYVYPFYFLVYEIASELLVIHAALYLGQNFDTRQAKRLTPVIMAGSQIGIIAGGLFLAGFSHTFGVQNMLLAWMALFFIGIIVISIWHAQRGASPFFRQSSRQKNQLKQAVTQVRQGLKFMKSSDLTKAASYSLFFLVIAIYILCYSVNLIYTQTFTTEQSLSSFFGIIMAVNSSLALFLQFFVTSRIINAFGVKKTNLIFPVTTLLSYIALITSFMLPSAIIGSLNKDSVMSAIRNPVHNMFINALPGYMQGRARAMSIVVVMPLALVVAGAILWTVQKIDNPVYFLAAGLIATCGFMFFNHKMNKAYAKELLSNLKQKLFVPAEHADNAFKDSGEEVFTELAQGVAQEDNQISMAFARILVPAFPDRASTVILQRVGSADSATADLLFNLLVPLNPPELSPHLYAAMENADDHLKATILRILFSLKDEKARNHVSDALKSNNPRIQLSGIYGAMEYNIEDKIDETFKRWMKLLNSDNISENIAGLSLLIPPIKPGPETYFPESEYTAAIISILNKDHPRANIFALQVIKQWPHGSHPELLELFTYILNDSNNPETRRECVAALPVLSENKSHVLARKALDDHHPIVRSAAILILDNETSKKNNELCEWILNKNHLSLRAQKTIIRHLYNNGVDPNFMQKVAVMHIAEAKSLLDAYETIKQSEATTAVELLQLALGERLKKLIDIALIALQSLEHPYTINIIRSGIRSKDARHIANACELLQELNNRQIGKSINEILELINEQSSDNIHCIKITLTDALELCSQSHDPWIQTCAVYTIESIDNNGDKNV